MREYKIRDDSLYSGVHYIYESVDEFSPRMNNPEVKVYKWGIDDYRLFQVGDYVQAEDGYIVQILAVKEMKTKKQRKGRTVFIRFPMGTFAIYERADGSVHYPRFYAQFTTGDKGSAAGRSRNNFTGNSEEAKKRFASLIFSGLEKHSAFRIAFNYYRVLTPSQIENKITRLFRDKVVINELRMLIDPEQIKLRKKFPDDMLLQHIKDLLQHCKKGSPEHRRNIEFILALRGII